VGGMTTERPQAQKLPHHTLVGYQLALELVKLVAGIRIGDAQLRQQARKSAASAALNSAEGAARQSSGDKRRSYAIALGEACECCAAVEIAGALGTCSAADVAAVLTLTLRIRRVMSPLVR
jgi:four helix bundle protein